LMWKPILVRVASALLTKTRVGVAAMIHK
jgi:hypothetical protein